MQEVGQGYFLWKILRQQILIFIFVIISFCLSGYFNALFQECTPYSTQDILNSAHATLFKLSFFISHAIRTPIIYCLFFDRLGKKSQIPRHATRIPSMNGCKICTPFSWAMAPTAKGNAVDPEAPIAAANPIADT
ncbi:hypothetical protein CPSG_03717 [Coccidioides posadasii str. Silveira]|uniref:Uncharacterized protein n=1 Tax=Coccidioides posadasii (strain RMSCC 757 / Silveira) TaxID=443226 RepID=E9D2B9_COCPS|nr:hypothetical protein CPSG_03717 [Coccidioides posadasii str. Silveira]